MTVYDIVWLVFYATKSLEDRRARLVHRGSRTANVLTRTVLHQNYKADQEMNYLIVSFI